MACSYGWDWGPITISSGIWKPIELIDFEQVAITSFSVISEVTDRNRSLKSKVDLAGEISGAVLRLALKDGEKIIASKDFAPGTELELNDLNVELWQPRGRGDQKLYQAIVELVLNGKVIQKSEKQVGFRTIELDTTEIKDGKHLFAIKVNGLRLWIRGANWIPDDPFPSRITRARYEKRISDMLEVNINGKIGRAHV